MIYGDAALYFIVASKVQPLEYLLNSGVKSYSYIRKLKVIKNIAD